MKLFAVAAFVCAAAFAGYTAYEQATMTDAERMMLANLEALTGNESGGAGAKYTFQCFGGDTFCVQVNNDIYYKE